MNPSTIAACISASAALSAAVAFGLLLKAMGKAALPGCGAAASGCDAVLQSRWSRVGPFPVAVFGFFAYVAISVAAQFSVRGSDASWQSNAWHLVVGAVPVMAIGALWFISVQAVLLRRFCVYCTLLHTFGLLTAGFVTLAIREQRVPWGTSSSTAVAMAVGTLLILFFVVGQIAWIPKMHSLELAFAGECLPAASTALSPAQLAAASLSPWAAFANRPNPGGRRVAAYAGKVVLGIDDWPLLGSPLAADVFVYFFDFTCDHCRHLHATLWGVIQGGHDFAVLLIPIPTESACNPYITCRKVAHTHACAYARLALGVWLAAPQAYDAYCELLLGGEHPLPLREAVARAKAVLGMDVDDPEIPDVILDGKLRSGIELHHSLGLRATPALLLRNGVLQGRVHGAAHLHEVLRKDATARPLPPSGERQPHRPDRPSP